MSKILDINSKYRIVLNILIFIFVFLISGALIVSIFSDNKKTKQEAIVTNLGDLAINYLDGNEISINLKKGEKIEYTFSITNTGTNKNYYSVYIKSASFNGPNPTITITDEKNKTIYDDVYESDDIELISLKSIKPSKTNRYKMIIKSDGRSNVSGKIEVINDSLDNETFADVLLSNNNLKQNKTNIGVDIANTSEGLIKTEDEKGSSYYFRGVVDDNYIKIGNYNFRVVRINGDNTVRVVLDDAIELKSIYNNVNTENITNSPLYENSIINIKLNEWYNNNLKEYDEILSNGYFCSDNNFVNMSESSKTSNTYQRAYVNNNPSLKCTGVINNSKIGLLSADEILFAGASKDTKNKEYYLYNEKINYDVWTSSSYEITNENVVNMITLGKDGSFSVRKSITEELGIRPVVNISNSAHLKGEGTKENPYILVS